MYSGEYDACDVTLSVYPHRASLKNMPDHGGNRTYDLWNTSPMLCQLSYAVWSVRVCDISEQNLVPSISMLSNNNHDFSVLVSLMYSGEYDACDVTLSVYPHRISTPHSIQKVRKMQNLGNVYICGSPFVMSRTEAQNGLDMPHGL